MSKVIIERLTNRCARSVNGAWVGAPAEHDRVEADESILKPGFSINSGITVTWGDGVKEYAFPFNGGAFPGYAPTCIPAGGRLSRLLIATKG